MKKTSENLFFLPWGPTEPQKVVSGKGFLFYRHWTQFSVETKRKSRNKKWKHTDDFDRWPAQGECRPGVSCVARSSSASWVSASSPCAFPLASVLLYQLWFWELKVWLFPCNIALGAHLFYPLVLKWRKGDLFQHWRQIWPCAQTEKRCVSPQYGSWVVINEAC